MRQVAVSVLLLTMLSADAHPASAQDPFDVTIGVAADDEGADILGAFTASLKLLLIEHGTRVAFQEKTRGELGGNFWSDYRRSVRVPGQWDDTDSWAVNYVGHPIHGAAAGYLWLDHEPGAPPDIDLTRKYWASPGTGDGVGPRDTAYNSSSARSAKPPSAMSGCDRRPPGGSITWLPPSVRSVGSSLKMRWIASS